MSFLRQWKAEHPLSDNAFDQLSRFASLIHEWNQRINLTGFKTLETIETNLIGEALAALQHLSIEDKSVLDFGSGAGIPGLAWAICKPSAQVTSLEIRQKKVAFQKDVVRELQIQAEILLGLFPEAVKSRRFDLIVSRAIRFSPSLWRDAKALVNPGGSIIRFAAANVQEHGWQSIPISDRSSLLVSNLSGR